MPSYSISFFTSFARREPVLKAMSGIKYTVVGQDLDLQRAIGQYSAHEQDVIQFVLNPALTFKVFGGLNPAAAQAMVKEVADVILNRNGNW